MSAATRPTARTTSDVRPALHPAAVWARRGAVALMVALVVAALGTWLGVETTSRSATGGGYRLTVAYPKIARAGLDVTWRVTVRHPGGFGRVVTLAVTGDYFDVFESQGFQPEPSSETRDGDRLLLTFTAPPGDTLVVTFDAYVQPAAQRGRSARVEVVEAGTPVAWVDLDTWLWP